MTSHPHPRPPGLTRRGFLAASLASAVAACAGCPRAAARGETAAGFRFAEQAGGRLALLDGARPVFTYNWGDQLKEGVPADRTRSCYVHPLVGLDGEVLTDDFPADHHHHRGVFWTWQRMKAAGQDVDLWTIRGIRQHFGAWVGREAGPEQAALAVANEWHVGETTVARETVRLAAHKADAAGRAIDVEVRLEAVSPVELLGAEGKGYGGLGLRFAPREDTVITIEEGRQTRDSDLRKSWWADLSARFAGREAVSGVAILVHPESPGAPNGWTLRHYGFLGPCWPALTPYTLEPGRPVTLRYRLWVHRGDAASGRVAEAWEAYRAAARAAPAAT